MASIEQKWLCCCGCTVLCGWIQPGKADLNADNITHLIFLSLAIHNQNKCKTAATFIYEYIIPLFYFTINFNFRKNIESLSLGDILNICLFQTIYKLCLRWLTKFNKLSHTQNRTNQFIKLPYSDKWVKKMTQFVQ